MSRALAPMFDPVTIRDNAKRAESYSFEHKCSRVFLMAQDDVQALITDLAILAEVTVKHTKGEPAYSTDRSQRHIKLRTLNGWWHVHAPETHPGGDDYTSLVGILSTLCNGYWVNY